MGASESKLAFKEDIFRLAGDEAIPIESQWWLRFLQLPETAEDVQTLWSPNDLRSLTLNTPAERPPLHYQTAPKKNIETLIYRTIGRLHKLQTTRVYDDPNIPITPEVLNGVRILTRLLPYIYEAEHLNDWEAKFFWTSRKPIEYADAQTAKSKYIDGLDDTKTIAEESKDATLGPPLGEQLVDILISYLFFPGFTLPPRRDANGVEELKPTFVVWHSGIGANKGVGMTRENERNAMEVLRLLLALSSRAMYMAPGIVADRDNKPLTYLTTQSDRQVILNTLCSLLNTVLKYNQNPWSFSAIDLATKDPKQSLVTHSLQFLLALITYPAPKNEANEFRKALGRLHRAEDFQFIVEGLRQILMQPTSSMLRPVQRLANQAPPIATETLSLFWELLQCNKRFRSYLIDTDRAKDFVVLVLYYAVEAKDDAAKQGVVRMCIFILQTLSVEGKFGRKLNSPFTFQETLPTVLQIPNFHGSYADFLIGHIHTLLTTPNRGLESLYPALLAVVNNIAPYVQDLQRATSSMLMNVFVSLSAPAFLLANDSNYALLFSLLDAMNAILDHQQAENRRFVDVIVKGRTRFEALRDFTVDGALEELDKVKRERKDAGEATGVRSPARHASLDSARGVRSPTLSNLPEESAFAIGEDDEDDEDGEQTPAIASPSSASTTATHDALPQQSRSMSEKAWGKQPVGHTSFSRSTSRNTSTTSLQTLNTHQSNPSHLQSQQFTPSAEWLQTWLPYLPLHQILQTIENVSRPDASVAKGRDAATMPATTTEHSRVRGETDGPKEPKEIKVQTFRWTSLALGWYMSMLWGWVYASDSARIWLGTNIRLFNVLSQRNEVSLRHPRGAVDAVGDTIARRIGSLNLGGSSQTMKEV